MCRRGACSSLLPDFATPPPHTHTHAQGKGPAATAVRNMLLKMCKERPPPVFSGACGGAKIGRVILIDREVDLITPLMTQVGLDGKR